MRQIAIYTTEDGRYGFKERTNEVFGSQILTKGGSKATVIRFCSLCESNIIILRAEIKKLPGKSIKAKREHMDSIQLILL